MKFAPDTGASDCRKTSFVDKKGVAGAEPPTGTRGGSPGKIPLSGGKGARGIGIVSQKFISKTDFFYGLTAVKKSRR